MNPRNSVGIALSKTNVPPGGFSAPSWDPTTPGNILAWFRADMGVSLSGSNVTAWADQSGGGHNLGTTSTFPTFSSTGWNSAKPALTFATNQIMSNSDAGFGQYLQGANIPFTVFATVNFATSNNPSLCEWGDNGITFITTVRADNTGKAKVDKFGAGAVTGTNVIWGANKRIGVVNDSSGNVTYWVDAATEINASSLPATLTTVDRILIGNNWNVANPMGVLTEAVFYSAVLAQTDFNNYRTWSANLWGG